MANQCCMHAEVTIGQKLQVSGAVCVRRNREDPQRDIEGMRVILWSMGEMGVAHYKRCLGC